MNSQGTESAAQTASARPQPPQVVQGRERISAQQSGQGEAKADWPRTVRPAEQPANELRSRTEMARTETSNGRTMARVERPTQPSPTDIAKLNEQLRALENKVASVIAIRRNSELFARVEALEAQYAKANQLSGKTKTRFDLLRLNMARKLPGPSPEMPATEPFIPPVVGR
jgi:TolA-binding protein